MAMMMAFGVFGFAISLNNNNPPEEFPELLTTNESDGNVEQCIYNCINSLPVEPISTSEAEVLTFVREEELLAHDVYVKLYQKYHLPAFNNISKSETLHSIAIKALLEKYNLPDPGANHIEGVFQNQDIQQLYNTLLSMGMTSIIQAKKVGCIIEDYDIYDLKKHISEEVDNVDITYTLENLYKGSRNHMRAFYRLLKFHNIIYVPQYISQEELTAIINHSHEGGDGFCICDPDKK